MEGTRSVLTSLFGFKATKIKSFTIKTRVKQVLGIYRYTVLMLKQKEIVDIEKKVHPLRPGRSMLLGLAAPAGHDPALAALELAVRHEQRSRAAREVESCMWGLRSGLVGLVGVIKQVVSMLNISTFL